MKKKLLTSLLSVAVLLTGCGGSESTQPANTQQTGTVTTTEEMESAIEETAESIPDASAVTVEEQVLLDQDGFKITLTGLEDDFMGPSLNVLIENNSQTDVTIQARNVSVNGYMVAHTFSADVIAGKKNNSSITFLSSSFEECGIEEIADVAFLFHIFDAESWDTILDSEIVEIQTSAMDSYQQNYDDSGTVLFEGNDIKIISKGISEDSMFGPGLILYMENNSEQSITVQARDTSVNGFMIDPTLSSEIAPGKKIISSMTFMDSDFEENSITAIEEIETSFHIFITDSWETIIDTEPINITF